MTATFGLAFVGAVLGAAFAGALQQRADWGLVVGALGVVATIAVVFLQRRLRQRDRQRAVANALAAELLLLDGQLTGQLLLCERVAAAGLQPLYEKAPEAFLPRPSPRLLDILDRDDTGLTVGIRQALRVTLGMLDTASQAAALASRQPGWSASLANREPLREVVDVLTPTRDAIRFGLRELEPLVSAEMKDRLRFHADNIARTKVAASPP